MHDDLQITVPEGRTFTVPGDALIYSASTASGPGGQNVNKVSTKVELRFDLEASSVFSDEQKERIRAALKNRIAQTGEIIITSQRSRVRLRNVDDVRAKLADLIGQALKVEKPRRPTAPSRRQKAKRLDTKKRDGQKKASRGSVSHNHE